MLAGALTPIPSAPRRTSSGNRQPLLHLYCLGRPVAARVVLGTVGGVRLDLPAALAGVTEAGIARDELAKGEAHAVPRDESSDCFGQPRSRWLWCLGAGNARRGIISLLGVVGAV